MKNLMDHFFHFSGEVVRGVPAGFEVLYTSARAKYAGSKLTFGAQSTVVPHQKRS